jgi:hypothetical protein
MLIQFPCILCHTFDIISKSRAPTFTLCTLIIPYHFLSQLTYLPSLKIVRVDLHEADRSMAYAQWLHYNHSKIIIAMWVGSSVQGSMFVFPGDWSPHGSMETTRNIDLTIVTNSLSEQEFLQEALHSLSTLFPNIRALQLWVHDPDLLAVSPVLLMFLNCWTFC